MIEVQTGSIKKVVKDADYGIVYGARLDYSVQQVYHENKSYITANLYYLSDVNTTWIGDRTHTVKINGVSQTINFTGYKDLRNGEVLVGTVTQAVSHNSDGNKTVAISFTYDLNKAWKGTNYATLSASKSVTLNRIPRPSTMSFAATTELGKSLVISITREASDFTHTLSYTIGSISDRVLYENVGTQRTWTIPIDLAEQITTATSGILGIKCTTYDGEGNLLGSTSKSTLVTVPESVIPRITTVGITDPTGCLSKYGAVVQGKSKLSLTVNASGVYGSTIKSYTHSSPYFKATNTTSNPYTTGFILSDDVDAFSYSVKVKDSRGRESAWTESTINNLPYKAPTISTLKAVRCTQDGTEDDGGEYIKVTMAGSITALNNINSKKFTLQYKKKADTEYTTAQTYTEYTLNTSAVFAADINSSYDVQLLATDDFSTTIRTAKVNTAYTLVDYNASGKGMAIGKASEKDAFEVAMPVDIINTVKLTSTGNQLKLTTNPDAMPFFIRNDGNNTYFMVGDAGADNYNNLRPFYITNSTGKVTIGNILSSTDKIVLWTNNKYLYGVNTAGTEYALIGLNSSNECHIAPSMNNIFIGSSSSMVTANGNFKATSTIGAKYIELTASIPYIDFHYNNGTSDYDVRLMNNASGNLAVQGNFVPSATNTYASGASDKLWSVVYAKTGTINTSDKKEKEDIVYLQDEYDIIFDNLKPVSYKFIDGTSGRTHIGFISQDVEESLIDNGMTALDFAGFCKDVKKKEVIKEDDLIEWVDDVDENGNPICL